MLTLICGIPNAGKTTFSKQFENALHQDELGTHVVEAVKEATGDVVIDGYFGTSEIRRKVLEAYNGQSRCIFLDIPTWESIRREDRHRHPQILRNAARFFEPPTYSEGWGEIITIHG